MRQGESRGGESHKKDKKTKISQGRSKKVSISKASTGNKRIEHLSYKVCRRLFSLHYSLLGSSE